MKTCLLILLAACAPVAAWAADVEATAARTGGSGRSHWHLGPFFEYRRAEPGPATYWAVRPFYSQVHDPATDTSVYDFLWPLSTLYAVEYMRHEQRAGHFYSWYLCSYSAVIFLAAAKNLFTLYIFYELLTLCTVPLVWHKRDEESTKAALVYMLYLIGGAALGLIAAVGFGVYYGTGDFAQGHLTLISNSGPACWMALLGFVGFGVKAAVLPLCRWLPKASVAPTPVTALLQLEGE